MTATICGKPAKCPHGTDLTQIGPWSIYADHCRVVTPYLGEWLFWCGKDEMNKPKGVSATEREYLAVWGEALIENDHRDALILNAGDDLYDEAANEDYHRTLEANDQAEYVQFMGDRPATGMSEHAEYLGEVPWSDRVDD